MRIYWVFQGDRYFSDCNQDHEEDDWKGDYRELSNSDGGIWIYIRLTVTLFSGNWYSYSVCWPFGERAEWCRRRSWTGTLMLASRRLWQSSGGPVHWGNLKGTQGKQLFFWGAVTSGALPSRWRREFEMFTSKALWCLQCENANAKEQHAVSQQWWWHRECHQYQTTNGAS